MAQPVPKDLFRAAKHNPLIAAYIQSWEYGQFSWEQMLLEVVLALDEERERSMRDKLKAIQDATSCSLLDSPTSKLIVESALKSTEAKPNS